MICSTSRHSSAAKPTEQQPLRAVGEDAVSGRGPLLMAMELKKTGCFGDIPSSLLFIQNWQVAIALRRDPGRACYMTQTLDVRVFTARRSDNKMHWTAPADRPGTWEPQDAIP